jgi:hypothetical protein
VAAVLLVGLVVAAQPPKGPDEKKDAPAKDAGSDEEYRRAATRLMDGIEVEVLVDEKWTKVKRIEQPILYYGDPTRENDRGSVWAWADKGRPVATLELFQNVNDRTKWAYAVCNTSGGKLRASRDGAAWWRENESATELKDVPGAPPPAAEAAPRQRQSKLLAGKFTGHEFWDPNNSRFELRRLEKPLYTYRDEGAGILDGALYALANGTNPEIMVFVEARANPKDGSKPVWKFAVGRSAHAELHLLFDDKEVYAAPRGDQVSGPNKPYWLGFFTTPREPKKD